MHRTVDSAHLPRNWGTQTYHQLANIHTGFEPIIEKPRAEAFGTASAKKKSRKLRNFSKFYDKEMDFVQHKYSHIASALEKRDADEEKQAKAMRDHANLMSSGSRKILHNKLKTTLINQASGKSNQTSKMFNTPVHERLFIDNINRQKRFEELKSFYGDFTEEEPHIVNMGGSRKALDLTGKMSFSKAKLNSYKSAGNFHIEQQSSKQNIADYLRETVESHS